MSVQGRTVFIKLVVELVSIVEVAHLLGRLLPAHSRQNAKRHRE